MIAVRKAADRGHFDHGWLDTYHTFSFASYHDPEQMGFRALRVINEDRVKGGGGFPMHPHKDMEIITYILEGALEHRDSMGNGAVIRPGEVQKMSAGTGITHSEMNPSPEESVHLLQIWIEPNQSGIEPAYEQIRIPEEEAKNRLCLVASPDGGEGCVTLVQDARLYVARLDGDVEVRHQIAPGRHAWVQVTRGAATLGGEALLAGDGAAVSGEKAIVLGGGTEILLFDLA